MGLWALPCLATVPGPTVFNSDNIPWITILVSYYKDLITAVKKISPVRLIHFTLKEHPHTHPDTFTRSHSIIAEICLTSKFPTGQGPYTQFFFQSLYLYWWHSLSRILFSILGSPYEKGPLGLCQITCTWSFWDQDGHISVVLVLEHEYEIPRYKLLVPPSNELHYPSFLRIADLVVALIGTEWNDLTKGGTRGHSPLLWTSRKRDEMAVSALLGGK